MNEQNVVQASPRKRYMEKHRAVVCPGKEQKTFGAIEQKYTRISSGAFALASDGWPHPDETRGAAAAPGFQDRKSVV